VHVSRILGAAAKLMRGASLMGAAAAAMIGFFVLLGGHVAAAAVIVSGGAVSWGVCRGLAHGLQTHADRHRIEADKRVPLRERPLPRVRWDAVRRWQGAERRAS
jgi:hypothetical protein